MFHMGQLAELQYLYPEYKGLTFESCLNGIRKETLQKVATYLIGKNLFSDQDIEIGDLIGSWFSKGNEAFAEQFFQKVADYEKKVGKKLNIVHTISCFKILQYGLELEEEGKLDTKSNEQSEIDLLFAMLICNQNEDYHQTKDAKRVKEMFPNNILEAILFSQSFAVSDILNFYFSDYTYCQVVKALLLFSFLESSAEGKILLNRFCDYFELSSWQEYIAGVVPMIMAWSNSDKASSVDLVLEDDEKYESNLSFLQKLAINDYVKLEDVDYIKIREKPLIQLDKNTFRVIHPLFIADKIYKGLYFLFNQLNNEEPKVVKSFRSWYTSKFTENICLREIINYSIPNPDAKFFDDELNAQGVSGPPDCYIRQERSVLLIENKDILINATIKSSYNFEDTINEIKKKLLIEDGRPVGIGQIITNIRKLLSGENNFDNRFDASTTEIYPVLIVHDAMYDTVGLNKILNSYFSQELSKLKDAGYDVSRVKSLTLVNIDAIISIADVLKDGRCSIIELLQAYDQNCTLATTGQVTESDVTRTLVPFSTFTINYLNNKLGKDWRSKSHLHHLFASLNISKT